MKFVSVIIPTKNRVQLLEQAILSVLTQPYSRFEFTIVDDGSIDETSIKVKGNFGNDSRTKYIRLESSKGGAVA